VLPVRFNASGAPEVMLITSRGTRRWVIPKGWPMKGRTAGQAAMVEAFEEAGLEGDLLRRSEIGRYSYLKVDQAGEARDLVVSVYLMDVRRQLADWPERAERETQWFSPKDAATLVAEPGLARIIRKVPTLTRSKIPGPKP
jgi:8-oxo-dGTP pyrophosphatase MutT (NUDIX family)